MANILTLPPELRDQIWSYLPSGDYTPGTSFALRTNTGKALLNPCANLKLTCRQLNAELTTTLYRHISLECRLPSEFLHWINQVGASNSSAIETLVLKTRSLPTDGSPNSWLYETGWALALRCTPRLRALTVHFEYIETDSASTHADSASATETPELVQQLSELALECCDVLLEPKANTAPRERDYRPDLSCRPYTHGVFSLNEKMPPVLVFHWNKSTRFTRNTERFPTDEVFTCDSMEENLTGLSPQFFEQNGLALTNTCTFSENNEHPNAHLTFMRKPSLNAPVTDYIQSMLQSLSSLQYLRVGSNELDSTFLRFIPKNVNTLDVAFRDDDPARVADNILTMRLVLWNLFTLAIEVSPLHDRKPADEDDQAEHFFERDFVNEDIQERWAPFWTALDNIKASKVKVWEGEGPGFRRTPRRINGEYLRS